MTPNNAAPNVTRGGLSWGGVVVGLVWLFGFAAWFHHLEIPNNHVPRWMFWVAVPFDLLDLIDPPEETTGGPWSWLFLLQRIPFLLIATAIWLGAWGLGSLGCRALKLGLSGAEHLFFALCLGLSLVSLQTLVMGICGIMTSAVLIMALAVPLALELMLRLQTSRQEPERIASHDKQGQSHSRWSWFAWLVFLTLVPFVACMMIGAMSPQTDFDVVEYHLGGPKEWFQQGQISRLPHNVYTSFPFLAEMLILAGMIFYGDWQWGALAGQAVIAGFAPLTALGVFAAGRRWFSERIGWVAALVYVTSPWTYRITIIAYVEGSLSCYLFAALYAGLILHDQLIQPDFAKKNSWGLAALSGLMSGSAMACKYTGLVMVVIPIGLLAVGSAFIQSQQRRLRSTLFVGVMFSSGVLLTIGPWLLKNAIETGNPVYPLGVRIFGGTDRSVEIDQKWRNAHAAKSYPGWNSRLKDLVTKIGDVTAINDWHSPLMFGLAPLALLLVLKRKEAPLDDNPSLLERKQVVMIAWSYVVWQFLVWFVMTHHIDRFYLPMFSAVAFLAGIGAAWWESNSTINGSRFGAEIGHAGTSALIAASLFYNIDVMIHGNISGFNAGRYDLKYAEQFADRIVSPSIAWWNTQFQSGRLSKDSKILYVGDATLFHAKFPYLYNTVFDHSIFEQICADPNGDGRALRSAQEIREELRRRGITHIDVNWAIILMYREPHNYGYTEFVNPACFAELQKLGILGPPLDLPPEIALAPLGDSRRQQLTELNWDSALIKKTGSDPEYVSVQIFPVIQPDR